MRRSLPIDLQGSAPDNPELRMHEAGADDAEAKAAFHLRLRARGIRDLAVLRALELVPRHLFVPHRYRHLACRDLPLPIGCGQTLEAPWLIARMIEGMQVGRTHRVLEVGSGSGYATALLAHLSGEVVGVERFRTLAAAAQARIAEFGLTNAAVVWADGLNLPQTVHSFDRILVHGEVPDGCEALLARLSDGGSLVCTMNTGAGHALVRVSKEPGMATVIIGECRLQTIQPGLAAAL